MTGYIKSFRISEDLDNRRQDFEALQSRLQEIFTSYYDEAFISETRMLEQSFLLRKIKFSHRLVSHSNHLLTHSCSVTIHRPQEGLLSYSRLVQGPRTWDIKDWGAGSYAEEPSWRYRRERIGNYNLSQRISELQEGILDFNKSAYVYDVY